MNKKEAQAVMDDLLALQLQWGVPAIVSYDQAAKIERAMEVLGIGSRQHPGAPMSPADRAGEKASPLRVLLRGTPVLSEDRVE